MQHVTVKYGDIFSYFIRYELLIESFLSEALFNMRPSEQLPLIFMTSSQRSDDADVYKNVLFFCCSFNEFNLNIECILY